MKANRAARDGPAPEAVSSVVAAILLFALFTTVFTMWTVTTLPEWIADREEAHADGVREAMASLASTLDSLSASDDAGPAAMSMALGPRPVALLQPSAATGELAVEGTIALAGTFTDEFLLFADGVAAGQPDEPIDEGAGDVLTDIELLQALVVRLTTEGVGNADTAWVEVVAEDGTSTVTARLVHAGKPAGSGANVAGCLNSELRLEVTIDVAPFGPTTSVENLGCELGEDLPGKTVDLASNVYKFADAVKRLDAPYSITLTDGEDGGAALATGYYAAAFLDSSGGGHGAGTGQAVDYTLDVQGQRLVYTPGYQHYSDQTVSWEMGGIVVAQEDGEVVAVGPAFDLTVASDVASLSWTVVELVGEGSHSGRGQATTRLVHDQTTDLVLLASGASFTVTSPTAAAWRSYFASQVLLADAGADATVGGTGTSATLTLTSTTVTEWRINLRLVQAHVEVL